MKYFEKIVWVFSFNFIKGSMLSLHSLYCFFVPEITLFKKRDILPSFMCYYIHSEYIGYNISVLKRDIPG